MTNVPEPERREAIERVSIRDRLRPSNSEEFLGFVGKAAGFCPGIGPAVAAVLGGWTQQRQQERIEQVLQGIADEIEATGRRLNEEYVRTDAFEDLLDHTLRRVVRERHDEKLKMYHRVLLEAVTGPGDSYDDHIRIVRAVEQLEPRAFRVLTAMRGSTDPTMPGLMHRLGASEPQREAIQDMIDHLIALGLAKVRGGEIVVTSFGHRFAMTVYGGSGGPGPITRATTPS